MTYHDAYHFLLSLQNLKPPHREEEESESAAARFTRLGHFLALFEHPHLAIPRYVHITGTSGKGSTATMIAAMLSATGKKVGLLTSPHISYVTERWQINGKPMPKTVFTSLIERLKTAFDTFFTRYPEEWITYHEMLTLIGFIYFAEQHVDAAVIEVGIGGDLDATNIIPHKDAAVITTVGADHLELLGPTLEDVARHKAGIITGKTSVLTSVNDPEHQAIIRAAAHAQGGSFTLAPDDYEAVKSSLEHTIFKHRGTPYKLHAFGEHQIKNALLAIATAEALGIPVAARQTGLERARFPLRFELVRKKPWCLVDGAHNPEKLASTAEAARKIQELIERETGTRPAIHLVVGFSRNKDVAEAIATLARTMPTTVAATRFVDNPFRPAASPGYIARCWSKILPAAQTSVFVDSRDALASALDNAKPSDIILVTGSIFLSGELRPQLLKKLRK